MEAHENIVLIGMPTSGKSTAGVILAKILGMGFVDTDLLIQKKTKKKLSELIESESLSGFLAIEEEVCSELGITDPDLLSDGSVIATGGSAVYGEEAMRHLREIGAVVYLQVDFEIIQARLRNIRRRGVVLREGQTLRDLYEERCALYEKYADLIVREGSGEIEAVVARIIRALRAGAES